eukprot:scaffold201_cov405-Prasinococcus_capsulatus_cf.AAC.60
MSPHRSRLVYRSRVRRHSDRHRLRHRLGRVALRQRLVHLRAPGRGQLHHSHAHGRPPDIACCTADAAPLGTAQDIYSCAALLSAPKGGVSVGLVWPWRCAARHLRGSDRAQDVPEPLQRHADRPSARSGAPPSGCFGRPACLPVPPRPPPSPQGCKERARSLGTDLTRALAILRVQGALVTSLFVHKGWVPQLPSPTPDEQKVIDFMKKNLKCSKIIGIVALSLEVASMLLACCLSAMNLRRTREEDDLDMSSHLRRPLMNTTETTPMRRTPGFSHTPDGTPDRINYSPTPRSDEWRARMQAKYGTCARDGCMCGACWWPFETPTASPRLTCELNT